MSWVLGTEVSLYDDDDVRVSGLATAMCKPGHAEHPQKLSFINFLHSIEHKHTVRCNILGPKAN